MGITTCDLIVFSDPRPVVWREAQATAIVVARPDLTFAREPDPPRAS